MLVCALLVAVAPLASWAALDDGVNRIRQRGCANKLGVKPPLRRSRGLDEVAREWSKGGRLQQALARTGYRAADSASIRIEGAVNERAILDVIAQSYCETVLNREFIEIGIHERRDGAWIVVAVPFTVPEPADERAIDIRVLQLVNAARAKTRKCGAREFGAAPPLTFSPVLSRAALVHAQDMSAHRFFDHHGSDGSRPSDRVTRVGYRWRAAGENIAQGVPDADSVVRGWLDSPGHCTNIMSPNFTEMGLAYYSDPSGKGDVYWVQVFGTPR